MCMYTAPYISPLPPTPTPTPPHDDRLEGEAENKATEVQVLPTSLHQLHPSGSLKVSKG